MTSSKIDAQITFLYVSDLEASARFYQDGLGLPLALDQGSCRIYRVRGTQAYLGVCLGDPPPDNDIALIFTLVTDDVDALHQRIVAAGFTPDHEPRHNPRYQIYHFFARDPDGYRIEVQRFDDPDWDKSQQPSL